MKPNISNTQTTLKSNNTMLTDKIYQWLNKKANADDAYGAGLEEGLEIAVGFAEWVRRNDWILHKATGKYFKGALDPLTEPAELLSIYLQEIENKK